MQKATISALKDRLSAYLKKVRAGQAVIIYDRDQPIARIERIEGGVAGDDRVARLERAGLMRRGKGTDVLALLKGDVPKARHSVTRALIDERRESR